MNNCDGQREYVLTDPVSRRTVKQVVKCSVDFVAHHYGVPPAEVRAHVNEVGSGGNIRVNCKTEVGLRLDGLISSIVT